MEDNISHFILHTKTGKREYLKHLAAGTACLILVLVTGYAIHSIGTAGAKSRELMLLYTGEEFSQHLLDTGSEEYNLNGRYQLEEDLDLNWLNYSIGTNIEPLTGKLDGNGHVISGLGGPLFGMAEDAEIENLFLSGAEILSPFAYSDGEHYVDGHGALAAYAIDSRIVNCGMNGAIYTASPAEVEYLLEKVNPSDAEERKGPGMVESTVVPDTQEEIGPNLTEEEEGRTEGNTGMEAGPGYETESGESMESESNVVEKSSTDGEKGPTGETSVTEGSNSEGTGGNTGETGGNAGGAGGGAGETGGSAGGTGGGTGEIDGNSNAEHNSGGTAEETDNNETSGNIDGGNNVESGNMEGGNSSTDSGNSGKENATDKNTEDPDTADSTTPKQEETNQSSFEFDGMSGGGSKVLLSISETVGYQTINRRQLMLKLPVMVDTDTESIQDSTQTASSSDAIPSDTQGPAGSDAPSDSGGQSSQIDENDMTFEEPEESVEYIDNPDGDIYILVVAKRVAVGGFITKTSGETLISNSFTLATISSTLQDIETYTGGSVGITGQDTRIENSYASGLADSDDITGGFTAIHNGFIQNSYSAMIIGEPGNVHAAFCASGDGQLDGCVFDIQMAYTGEITQFAEETSGEFGFPLKGLSTGRMTGADPKIPGTWCTTDEAYPQIESSALSDQETIASTSKVSATALSLPEDRSLVDVVTDGGLILLVEIGGQTIDWEAGGGIRIDENNQILIESGREPESKNNNQTNAAAR